MGIDRPDLILTDEADQEARRAILRPLVSFNERLAGPLNYRPLSILVVHPRTAEIVGGLWGHSSWDWLTIGLLFVPEDCRGAGLGSEIMRLAETEALKRGCVGAVVDTHSFQAPGFYEKLGFERFGEMSGFPPSHSRIFLQKRF